MDLLKRLLILAAIVFATIIIAGTVLGPAEISVLIVLEVLAFGAALWLHPRQKTH